ncbi:hypothetical protein IU450_28115 [Nocardia abscessus]|uniref:hypothetical protein n=1 Tax=Nocardia abscessus TaxID=120957 RepID=UPI001894251B|nr:hypothetical protein [Nocardia abscessus]MBF6339728.1 hypothetical protein [Nocardia abscessus]
MPTDTEAAEAALTRLANVGVDFSVQRSDLISWLGNPDFTPFPAIAAAVMNLLSPKPLRRPVYLDVVVFNYEQRSGSSPRRVEDIDQSMLMAAVLEASNSRYGTGETDFTSLLKN